VNLAKIRNKSSSSLKVFGSDNRAPLLQEPPMRDWLFLLTPPAMIFYFIAFPDRFGAFVAWARTLM